MIQSESLIFSYKIYLETHIYRACVVCMTLLIFNENMEPVYFEERNLNERASKKQFNKNSSNNFREHLDNNAFDSRKKNEYSSNYDYINDCHFININAFFFFFIVLLLLSFRLY